MEQDGADIMIGPLSGDESIAVANYAKQHPDKTFVDGAAGAQDTTLKVRAPNFFRFNGDGAQWNAGLGDIAYNKLHWRTAAVVSDDYSFGWTSAAGFIADFCAAGGQIVAAGVPAAEHDGLLVLRAADHEQRRRHLRRRGRLGPDPVPEGLRAGARARSTPRSSWATCSGARRACSVSSVRASPAPTSGSAGTAGDLAAAAPQDYANNIIGKWFKTIPPAGAAAPQASSTFTYGYYVNTWGLIKGLEAVKGNIGGGQKALQAATAKVVLPAPYGTIKLDQNRQAIFTNYNQQLYLKNGKLAVKTVGRDPERHPDVRWDVQQLDPGSGADRARVCEAQPAVAWARTAGEDTRLSRVTRCKPPHPNTAEPILRLRGVGRRFGGLAAVSDVDLDVAPGERRAILGPNGAGKTTLFNLISGDIPATSGTIAFLGEDLAVYSARRPHEARHGAHLPEVAPVPRPERRGQPLPGRARNAQRALPHAPHAPAIARCASAPASWPARSVSSAASRPRRLALARRAAPARGRHGAGHPTPS